MATWEEKFRGWVGGPGDTEHARCENAEGMILKAIASDIELKSLGIRVFSQGSFKNVTNIPQESDVDVSVCLMDTMYVDIPAGTNRADFGIGASNFEYPLYKASIVSSMRSYFGNQNVTVGNKAIRIHSNTYRVDADVVPNVLYRQYFDKMNCNHIREGVRFRADDGKWITNYPEQHTAQGIVKNMATAKRFKRVARILKSLQVEMLDKGAVKHRLPSFLIESLVFNTPDQCFGHPDYTADVRAVVAHVFNNTRNADDPSKWLEVNNVKYLFHDLQPWSKNEVHAFVASAWSWVGFR